MTASLVPAGIGCVGALVASFRPLSFCKFITVLLWKRPASCA
jgi:hypothetical protein